MKELLYAVFCNGIYHFDKYFPAATSTLNKISYSITFLNHYRV